MSDPMMPGGPGGGVQGKMSVFNPTDMAAKVATGDVRPDMTVGEFLQRNFGVSPNDPVQKLVQATKGQIENRTMAGKMGAPQAQRPQPRPAMPTPQPQPTPNRGSLDSLVNRMQ